MFVVDLTHVLIGYFLGHCFPVISTSTWPMTGWHAWPRLEILPHARLISYDNEKREFIKDWKSCKITLSTISMANQMVTSEIRK